MAMVPRRADGEGLGVFRSRFFWKLWASYSAVLIATAVVVGVLVGRRLEHSLLEGLEDTLREEAVLLEPLAARALRGGVDLQGELARVGEATDVRVTLIRPDGTVVGDTDREPAALDDHGARPEVRAARDRGTGVARRFSDSVGFRMLYVARAVVQEDGLLGFVRVALPVDHVDAEIRATGRSVAAGVGIGLLVALVLSLYVAQRTTAPIAEMTRVAEDLRRGDFESRARVRRKDDIGVLAETLNRLGREVTTRIATISQDDAQLRAMLTGMVEGVVAVDEEERIAFCNRAARSLLGIDGETVVGRSLWDVAPLAELEELLSSARASRSQERRDLELFRSGREQVLEAHASPFAGGGRNGLVVVLHDISDLRRLERIRRDFVANVSHELKTPLTSIKGFVETLLTGALHDDRNNVRFLQRIDANVDRLTHLVSDLLSLARIESQGDAMQRTRVDWRSVLEDVLRRHEAGIRDKALEVHASGTDAPLHVLGDREAMTQVLDNLVDNAIKYTPGPGSIRVELVERDARGLLCVADSGVGIPPGDLDRIFERFYRVDKARSREVGGTGLGLSIVKHLVMSMGGDVRVESEPGSGSRFTVELPLA